MPFVDIENRAVAYRDIGPKSAPAVLLAHPLGMTQAVWDEVIGTLVGDFRLITWDLPGHGASAAAAGPLSADDLATEAVALLDARGVARAHFVGTSIGGVVGQALLVTSPDRIERVALTNTGAVIGQPDLWHQRAARVRNEGLIAMAPELVDRWFGPAFKTGYPAAVSGWQTQLGRCDDESYAWLCELLAEADFTGRLTGVDRRVHLLTGAEDGATPPATLDALAGELPNSERTVLEAVGHVPSIEAPEPFADWLADRLGERGTTPPVDYEQGLAIRKSVLGAEHVERASNNATTLDAPFQNMITRLAWGELWGNTDLTQAERSMITLAVLAALGRDGELELHLKTAKRIGLSEAQLRQALMHVAIYAGVPAANHAFKLAKQHGWGQPLD
ncbi:bifunctional 3-oxoadipate enol-lactonase/4-carboxymuconolactone decarboxylase PcaDC [Salinisphaera hydrothermalis]|uniref:bifunctional 3-oxoadipate enol-lactonase/4-carboxymuconolactone decarboxylase PcaDC n=1 Tax=Salinisphaera hydrothermalis TaxID=563188 RepID=UPI0033423D52